MGYWFLFCFINQQDKIISQFVVARKIFDLWFYNIESFLKI